jgi:polyphenol oxidase
MISYSNPEYEVFFCGNKFSINELNSKFPNACILKQVHSDICVEATKALIEADAHWTKKSNQPLIIQTADCLPVMIYLPRTGSTLAIHAGWRGVEQKIVSKSLTHLKIQDRESIHVYIGPHIQKNSFEVDMDVAKKIMAAHGLDLIQPYCEEKSNKYHIDLSALVIREIKSLYVNMEVLTVSAVDTKTDSEFFSYRNGDRGGRNYSIINKKSASTESGF